MELLSNFFFLRILSWISVSAKTSGRILLTFNPRNRGITPPKTFWLGREANTRHQAEKKRPKHGVGGTPKLTIKKKKNNPSLLKQDHLDR